MRLIKNKKGSAIIENIILAPLMIYVVMFSAFQLLSWYYSSQVYTESASLVRKMAVGDDFESAMNIAAENLPSVFTISEITLCDPKATLADERQIKVTFSLQEDSNFNSYITAERKFRYNDWGSTQKHVLEQKWKAGVVLKIKVTRVMAREYYKLLAYRIYDPVSNQMLDLSLGFNATADAYAEYIIIF